MGVQVTFNEGRIGRDDWVTLNRILRRLQGVLRVKRNQQAARANNAGADFSALPELRVRLEQRLVEAQCLGAAGGSDRSLEFRALHGRLSG